MDMQKMRPPKRRPGLATVRRDLPRSNCTAAKWSCDPSSWRRAVPRSSARMAAIATAVTCSIRAAIASTSAGLNHSPASIASAIPATSVLPTSAAVIASANSDATAASNASPDLANVSYSARARARISMTGPNDPRPSAISSSRKAAQASSASIAKSARRRPCVRGRAAAIASSRACSATGVALDGTAPSGRLS
jgi:hypothetical protein